MPATCFSSTARSAGHMLMAAALGGRSHRASAPRQRDALCRRNKDGRFLLRAHRFAVIIGITNLFADMTYEARAASRVRFSKTLGAAPPSWVHGGLRRV